MKSIGVFCADNAVFCVERLTNKPGKIFTVDGSEENSLPRQPAPGSILLSREVFDQFGRQFEKNFKTGQISLALPTRDIIFRSFVIPWMETHQIKSAVEFEADKYLPFRLDELCYFYHSVKFTQDGKPRLRIIFIGIKKQSLAQYIDRFKQIGLRINRAEPADISLIQALASFGEISQSETVTLVKRYRDRAKLMIIDHGIPLFVREFPLSAPDMDTDGAAVTIRLANEIRISLDYFTRQDQQLVFKKILFLTSMSEPVTAASLQDVLAMPVASIDISRFFSNHFLDNPEYLNAYGIGIKNSFGLSVDFNAFSEEESGERRTDAGESKTREMITGVGVIILSIILIGAGLMLPGFLTRNYDPQIQQLKSRLHGFENRSTLDLQTEYNTLTEKMEKLRTMRTGSDVAFFLKSIGDLLPEGVWLRDFDMSYRGDETESSKRLELTLSGYSYAADSKIQFSQVSAFVNRLKNEKAFADRFASIELNSLSVEELNGYRVANFKITCH